MTKILTMQGKLFAEDSKNGGLFVPIFYNALIEVLRHICYIKRRYFFLAIKRHKKATQK